jgi:hypothetical protein
MHRITTAVVSAALLLTCAVLAWATDEPATTKTQKQTQAREQE